MELKLCCSGAPVCANCLQTLLAVFVVEGWAEEAADQDGSYFALTAEGLRDLAPAFASGDAVAGAA